MFLHVSVILSTPTPAQCMLGYSQQASGMHPTGMHCCFWYQNCFCVKSAHLVITPKTAPFSTTTCGVISKSNIFAISLTSYRPQTKFVKVMFLGGLSSHLNHLIASHVANYNWPFGTLLFGLFGSNLDTRDLETYPRTYSGHF